ncbi:MAG: hypothetical protein GXP29_12400 [Planctomycetes bacterium]|nr:hypothetical protein [Planctomycetota bacterium]
MSENCDVSKNDVGKKCDMGKRCDMGEDIVLATTDRIDAGELLEFYVRMDHPIMAEPSRVERMISQTFCFVTARLDGKLVGIARGITDGMHGFLSECKLDPALQGPACVTKRDGRIEHDSHGLARDMALRVVAELESDGVDRIQVLAHGTEVDFCEELGFRRDGGMVALHLPTGHLPGDQAPTGQSPADHSRSNTCSSAVSMLQD